MRKYFFSIVACILMLTLILPTSSSAAIADGTYSIDFQVNKPSSNSASMANDYFLKPAKLIVKNGAMTIQLTIKNSNWVTQFNPPGGAKVIASNEGANQRTVQFSVANPHVITIAMKIDIDDIDYHHAYSVDFVFDSSGLPEAQPEEPKEEPKEEPQQETKPVQQQPAQPVAPTETPKSSSGSNASSNEPTTALPKDSATESSQPVDQSKSTADNSVETEQTDQSEVIENPETSDKLPLLALLLFIGAAIVFVRTKQTKTNG